MVNVAPIHPSGGAAMLIYADGFESGDTSAWWLAGR